MDNTIPRRGESPGLARRAVSVLASIALALMLVPAVAFAGGGSAFAAAVGDGIAWAAAGTETMWYWADTASTPKTLHISSTQRSDSYSQTTVVFEAASDAPWYASRTNFASIVIDGDASDTSDDVVPTSTSYWFYGLSNAKTIEGLENLDVSSVKDASHMFDSATNLSVDMSKLHFTSCENMDYMFQETLRAKVQNGTKTVTVEGEDGESVQTEVPVYNFAWLSEVQNLTSAQNFAQGSGRAFGAAGDSYAPYEDLGLAGVSLPNLQNAAYMFRNVPRETLDLRGFSIPAATTCRWMFEYDDLSYMSGDETIILGAQGGNGGAGFTCGASTLTGMFLGNYHLKSISFNGTSFPNAVFLDSMFSSCTDLVEVDFSTAFEKSPVLTVSSMFSNCSSLGASDSGSAAALDLTKLSMANVSDASSMFSGCTALKQVAFPASFAEAQPENLSSMFKNCASMETIDVSNLDTSKASVGDIFFGCVALKNLKVGTGFTWCDPSDESTLAEFPAGNNRYQWYDESGDKVCTGPGVAIPSGVATTYTTGASSPTYGVIGYAYDDSADPKTLTFVYAATASGLAAAAASAGIGSVEGFFSEGDTFVTVNAVPWYSKGYSQEMRKVVFDSSMSSARPLSTAYWFYGIGDRAVAFEGFGNLNTSSVTTMSGMFQSSCLRGNGILEHDSASGYYAFPKSFTTSSVTDLSYFLSSSALPGDLDLSNLDVSAVRNLYSTFWGLSGAKTTKLNVTGWDTSSVTSMTSTFRCNREIIGLEGFDTHKVKSFNTTFYSAQGISELDLRGWDVSSADDFKGMFANGSGLTKLDISTWTTKASASISNLFCWNADGSASAWNLEEFKVGAGFGALGTQTVLLPRSRNTSNVEVGKAWYRGDGLQVASADDLSKTIPAGVPATYISTEPETVKQAASYTVRFHVDGDRGVNETYSQSFEYSDYKALNPNEDADSTFDEKYYDANGEWDLSSARKRYTRTVGGEVQVFRGWTSQPHRDAAHSSNVTINYAQDAKVNALSDTGGTIDLYGVWAHPSYSVTYSGNGGTFANANGSAEYTPAGSANAYAWNGWVDPEYMLLTTVAQLPGLVRAGYVFTGWSTDPIPYEEYYDNDGNVVAEGDADTAWSWKSKSYRDGELVRNLTWEGAITLYAQWIPASYTFAYHGFGGTTSEGADSYTQTADLSENLNARLETNRFSRAGYSFAGWATEEGGEAVYGGGAAASAVGGAELGGTVDLWAVWSPVSYTLKFDAAGGTGRMDDTGVKAWTDVQLPSNQFTRDGYVFAGWAEAQDSATVDYRDGASVVNPGLASAIAAGETVTASSVGTLYAVWTTEAKQAQAAEAYADEVGDIAGLAGAAETAAAAAKSEPTVENVAAALAAAAALEDAVGALPAEARTDLPAGVFEAADAAVRAVERAEAAAARKDAAATAVAQAQAASAQAARAQEAYERAAASPEATPAEVEAAAARAAEAASAASESAQAAQAAVDYAARRAAETGEVKTTATAYDAAAATAAAGRAAADVAVTDAAVAQQAADAAVAAAKASTATQADIDKATQAAAEAAARAAAAKEAAAAATGAAAAAAAKAESDVQKSAAAEQAAAAASAAASAAAAAAQAASADAAVSQQVADAAVAKVTGEGASTDDADLKAATDAAAAAAAKAAAANAAAAEAERAAAAAAEAAGKTGDAGAKAAAAAAQGAAAKAAASAAVNEATAAASEAAAAQADATAAAAKAAATDATAADIAAAAAKAAKAAEAAAAAEKAASDAKRAVTDAGDALSEAEKKALDGAAGDAGDAAGAAKEAAADAESAVQAAASGKVSVDVSEDSDATSAEISNAAAILASMSAEQQKAALAATLGDDPSDEELEGYLEKVYTADASNKMDAAADALSNPNARPEDRDAAVTAAARAYGNLPGAAKDEIAAAASSDTAGAAEKAAVKAVLSADASAKAGAVTGADGSVNPDAPAADVAAAAEAMARAEAAGALSEAQAAAAEAVWGADAANKAADAASVADVDSAEGKKAVETVAAAYSHLTDAQKDALAASAEGNAVVAQVLADDAAAAVEAASGADPESDEGKAAAAEVAAAYSRLTGEQKDELAKSAEGNAALQAALAADAAAAVAGVLTPGGAFNSRAGSADVAAAAAALSRLTDGQLAAMANAGSPVGAVLAADITDSKGNVKDGADASVVAAAVRLAIAKVEAAAEAGEAAELTDAERAVVAHDTQSNVGAVLDGDKVDKDATGAELDAAAAAIERAVRAGTLDADGLGEAYAAVLAADVAAKAGAASAAAGTHAQALAGGYVSAGDIAAAEEALAAAEKALAGVSDLEKELDGGSKAYTDAVKAVDALRAAIAAASPSPTVDAPSGATLPYTGAAQVGVAAGEGYTLEVAQGSGAKLSSSGSATATAAGTYTVTAKLAAGYLWSDTPDRADKSVTFTISALSVKGAQVAPIPAQTYTGGAIEPAVTVTLGGKALSPGTDYTVAYSGNTAPGTAKVTVTGTGNYRGSAGATFQIVSPSADALSKLDSIENVPAADLQAALDQYEALSDDAKAALGDAAEAKAAAVAAALAQAASDAAADALEAAQGELSAAKDRLDAAVGAGDAAAIEYAQGLVAAKAAAVEAAAETASSAAKAASRAASAAAAGSGRLSEGMAASVSKLAAEAAVADASAQVAGASAAKDAADVAVAAAANGSTADKEAAAEKAAQAAAKAAAAEQAAQAAAAAAGPGNAAAAKLAQDATSVNAAALAAEADAEMAAAAALAGDAGNAKSAAEQAVTQAKSGYETAKGNLETAKEALSELSEGDEGYDDAVAAVEKAEGDLAEAARAVADAAGQAEQAAKAAEKAAKAADTAAATAQSALDAAPQDGKQAAQQKADEAKSQAGDAQVASASAALAQANAANVEAQVAVEQAADGSAAEKAAAAAKAEAAKALADAAKGAAEEAAKSAGETAAKQLRETAASVANAAAETAGKADAAADAAAGSAIADAVKDGRSADEVAAAAELIAAMSDSKIAAMIEAGDVTSEQVDAIMEANASNKAAAADAAGATQADKDAAKAAYEAMTGGQKASYAADDANKTSATAQALLAGDAAERASALLDDTDGLRADASRADVEAAVAAYELVSDAGKLSASQAAAVEAVLDADVSYRAGLANEALSGVAASLTPAGKVTQADVDAAEKALAAAKAALGSLTDSEKKATGLLAANRAYQDAQKAVDALDGEAGAIAAAKTAVAAKASLASEIAAAKKLLASVKTSANGSELYPAAKWAASADKAAYTEAIGAAEAAASDAKADQAALDGARSALADAAKAFSAAVRAGTKTGADVGAAATVAGAAVKVASATAVTYTGPASKSAKAVTVPASVTINKKLYTVTKIAANAFKGSKATKVTVPNTVAKIEANAFKGSKLKTLVVKATGYKKASVKGALKGLKKVTVKVPKKKLKAYKKVFTKKVTGAKKVTVKK